jgi:hypothetical protein
MQTQSYTQDISMAIPPPDPRDHAVSLTARNRLAPPETDDSVARARHDAALERRDYVSRIGRHSPRNGLIAIIVQHADARDVINELFALQEQGHSWGQLRMAFNRLLEERWGR